MNDEDYIHYTFPQFLKDFLIELADTKFYKKSFDSRHFFDEGYELPSYLYFDWECLSNKKFNPETIIDDLLVKSRYGDIPHYKGDKLKTVTIDFKNKHAYIERGWATEYYASYVLSKEYTIPKYMQPLIDKLFEDYDRYIEEGDNHEKRR